MSFSRESGETILARHFASVERTDVDGRITFANERLLEMFGYTREEVLGRAATDFASPESRRCCPS